MQFSECALVQHQKNKTMFTGIIFGIVMLHLLAGFGYILYKLRPKK